MHKALNYSSKIMMLTVSFPLGPGEAFLDEEFRSMAAQGKSLTIVPLRPRGIQNNFSSLAFLGVKLENKPLLSFKVATGALLQFIRTPLGVGRWLWYLLTHGRPSVRLKNLAVLPKALWLARRMQAQGVEHLHVHWAGTTATCGMVAADIAGIPWSLTCHRWDIYENNLLAEKGRRAAFVRFISNRGMADACYLGMPPAKAIVIHMGVKIPENRTPYFNFQPRRLRIICAANLIAIKGHRYLLDAVRLLVDRGVSVELSLAGQGNLLDSLKAHANALSIESNIKFLGQVDHRKLIEMYASHEFDVFVLPSIDIGNGEHEGIPVSLMEAMANGIPVISTQTGSIEELLTPEMGATVPQRDAPALANILLRLALELPYRISYLKFQQKIIRRWSSDLTARVLINFISQNKQ